MSLWKCWENNLVLIFLNFTLKDSLYFYLTTTVSINTLWPRPPSSEGFGSCLAFMCAFLKTLPEELPTVHSVVMLNTGLPGQAQTHWKQETMEGGQTHF